MMTDQDKKTAKEVMRMVVKALRNKAEIDSGFREVEFSPYTELVNEKRNACENLFDNYVSTLVEDLVDMAVKPR
jgi:hypothetical protein